MRGGQRFELLGVELVRRDGGNAGARGGAQGCRPDAALKRRTLTHDRPGPISATSAPSISTANTPSITTYTSVAASPCVVSVAPASSVLIFGFAPPRRIVDDSSRSRAVSVVATSTSESYEPQGVPSPKQWPPTT